MLFAPYPHVIGGMERVTEVLASELPAAGWEAVVVAPGEGPFVDRLRSVGVEVIVVTAPAPLRRYGGRPRRGQAVVAFAALPLYWWRLRRALLATGAMVVHTGEHRGALLVGPAARLAKVPLIWQIHSVEASRVISCLSALVATRVLVPSTATTAAVGRLPRRPVVVPNPVVIPEPASVEGSEAHDPSRPPVVLTCGRLHPVKGFDVLLQAIERLGERGVALRLVVMGARQPGHEEHADALERHRRTAGLVDVVDFAGYCESPFARWSDTAVYVQPSRHETFGLAVAEAMTAGLPVVVSEIGGLAELVEPDRTGLLVPPGDPVALADAIERLLVDRNLAARLASAGRAEIAARFGSGVDATVAVYEEALPSRIHR